MYPVSAAYKEQIEKQIRNHSFVRIRYGIYNLPAGEQAELLDNGHEPFSGLSLKDDILPDNSYITFEKDRMKVGSPTQIILPKENDYVEQGFVSTSVSGADGKFAEQPIIRVTFLEPQDIYGLTLQFDTVEGTYPLEISINGTSYYPDNSQFVIFDRLFGVEALEIKFIQSYKPFWRARLDQILFGQTVQFTNKELISVKHTSSIDFVSGSLSKKTLTFTIDNSNQLYNPLNPKGVTEFIDERQPIKIEYGYELDNGIVEWIVGDNLVLDGTPKTNKNEATFSAIDNLSNMEDTFYKGKFRQEGIDLYTLAEEVLIDAEVEDYVLDERLRSIKTTGALPIASHRECLQIIANAAQCTLYTNRDGAIEIETALDPIIRVSDNGHLFYSDTESAFNDMHLPDQKYIELLPNSLKLGHEKEIILPESNTAYIRRGFISDVYSDENGIFLKKHPTYTMTYSFPYTVYEIPIVFDNVDNEFAVNFNVNYFLNGNMVSQKQIRDNSLVNYSIKRDAGKIDQVDIEILTWSIPYHRAVINQVGHGRVNNMRIDFNSALERPSITKQALTKSVEVYSYNYTPEAEVNEIDRQKLTVNGSITLKIQHDAAYNIVSEITGGTIQNEEHYSRYSVITLVGEGDVELALKGNRVLTSQIGVSKKFNVKGISQPAVQNPLITDITNAAAEADWIADYYNKRNKLKIEYRGNPEIDPYDIVYAESEFKPLFPVRVQNNTISFNGSLSGSMEVVVI